jgi:signal transduction histidine kinase
MRLGRVAELIAGIDPALDRELDEARSDLANLALGIHPSVLSEHGLGAALEQLAARSPVAVSVTVDELRLPPPVESAFYFISSEALANIAKHARAHTARVAVMNEGELARLVVSDDGVGGADPTSGAGLRGLADRIEALGGRLRVSSIRGAGTTLEAEVPR